MELVYRSADSPPEADYGDRDKFVGRFDYEWKLRVTHQNDDGTQRIVFRQRWATRSFNPEAGDKAYGEPSVFFDDGYFDLAPDGRIVENWTIHAFCNPTVVFPPLPPDRASVAPGWCSNLAFDGTIRRMSSAGDPIGADQTEWLFSELEEKLEHQVALTTLRRYYVFDLKQGLVQQMTRTADERWSSIVRPAIPIDLVSVKQLDPGELDVLVRDSDAYYQARKISDRLLTRASHELAHTKVLLDEARSTLAAAGEQVSSPFVKAMLTDKLDDYGEQSDRFLRRGDNFGKLLNTPSQEWQTTDLDGHTHALQDYRGKLVVLDFWSRSCAWCIRAMPDLNELVDDFPNGDVAILGVNMDVDEKNARFVVETAKLNYPTLKNGVPREGLDKSYSVTANPTMIVLDGRGVIRQIHVGYSPTLRADLGQVLRELLAEEKERP